MVNKNVIKYNNISNNDKLRADKIGIIYQQNNLLGDFTALENVAIPTIIIAAISKFAALGFLAHHEIILYITYDTSLDSKIIGVSSIPS